MLYQIRDGKIQTVAVEFSAARHCNLRCADCSHLSPHAEPWFLSPGTFATDLRRLAEVLHAHTIKLLGGEPLLNPEIGELARIAQASGIADRVVVITNGLLLHKMDDSFWRQVDVVRVSLYPDARPTPAMLDAAAARARETGTVLILSPCADFRATIVTEPHPPDFTTRVISATCATAHQLHCHMVSDGRLYKCNVPVDLPEYVSRLGRNDYDSAPDGVYLHDGGDLFAGLKRYLFSREPLDCCRYCLGTAGVTRVHRQLTKPERDDPAAMSVTRATHLSRAHLLRGVARRVKWEIVDGLDVCVRSALAAQR